jgi:hypothetical protein
MSNEPGLQVLLANDLTEVFINNGYEINTINILDMLATSGLMLTPSTDSNVASQAYLSLIS